MVRITLEARFSFHVRRQGFHSMYGGTCDRTCAYPRKHKIPSTSEKLPVPTSLSTVQLHTPKKNFIVATATLVNAIFCLHNSALSCFFLNETFDMLKRQEILYFGYANPGSSQLLITKSTHSCRQGHACELKLLHQFLLSID